MQIKVIDDNLTIIFFDIVRNRLYESGQAVIMDEDLL